MSSLKLYRLDGNESTWLFSARTHASAIGTPELLYWGPRLTTDPIQLEQLARALTRPVPHGMLDDEEPLSCLPEAGRGFSGHPGLKIDRDGHDGITQLELRATQLDDPTCLHFLLDEKRTDVSVSLDLRVMPDSDVLTASTSIHNRGTTTLSIRWLTALALSLPHRCSEVMLFDGRWCGELAHSRQHLATGMVVKENRLGRTSHHSFPAMLAGEPGFDDERGEVFACHLGWSGNHRLLAERVRDGRIQLQSGELLEAGEIDLGPGDSYTTPTLFATRSSHGSNGLAANFHHYVRNHLLPRTLRRSAEPMAPRPVHFNTWESLYFDHSEARTLELVAEAAACGAERFVLDDGWFKGRNNDRAGLGDWTVCLQKYPNGLEVVADAVGSAGMQFGLWVEPEMIQIDSDLYRQHPQWLMGADHEQPLGRHQYALDLDRNDVQEHLLSTLIGLVDRYRLGYLKWDMNRDLCHVNQNGRASGHQQTLASYRLIDALRAARPQLEIEACASGGARIDYAMLARSERFWVSDSHDPLERQRIHRSFNLFFPPEVMGAHVGSERCHTSGRKHTMEFRAATALFGHFGLEASFGDSSASDRKVLSFYVELYKNNRNWLHSGQTRYLESADPGCCARLAISANGEQALLSLAQLTTPLYAVPPRIQVTGLIDDALYQVRLLNAERHTHAKLRPSLHLGEAQNLDGRSLRLAGFQAPLQFPESIALFSLRRLESPASRKPSP